MFLEPNDTAFECLRQGDILAGIPFPRIELHNTTGVARVGAPASNSELPTLSCFTHEHRGDPNWFTLQAPARLSFCVVLSHCCDLEPRNGRVRIHAIALARLRPLSPDILRNPELLASLSANKDPRSEDPGYIDQFYIPPHPKLLGAPWAVHFSQMMSVMTTGYDEILRRKVLQMNDRDRMKFKIKLAYSLGRPNDEELSNGLADPWAAIPDTAVPQPEK